MDRLSSCFSRLFCPNSQLTLLFPYECPVVCCLLPAVSTVGGWVWARRRSSWPCHGSGGFGGGQQRVRPPVSEEATCRGRLAPGHSSSFSGGLADRRRGRGPTVDGPVPYPICLIPGARAARPPGQVCPPSRAGFQAAGPPDLMSNLATLWRGKLRVVSIAAPPSPGFGMLELLERRASSRSVRRRRSSSVWLRSRVELRFRPGASHTPRRQLSACDSVSSTSRGGRALTCLLVDATGSSSLPSHAGPARGCAGQL